MHIYEFPLHILSLIHIFGWDATSDVVPDWVYEGYANKYALDKTVQDWMRNVNPWALQRITEILLEASQRGYWDASPEILQDLQSLFISMEGVIAVSYTHLKQQRIFVFPKGTTKIDDFKQTEVTSEMSIDPNLK